MNPREARLEKRLIHFYLLNNFLKERKNTTAIAKTVSDLKKLGINRTISSLMNILLKLKNHPEMHTLPSLIKKEPSLDRDGKDRMYAAFWRMIEIEAQDVDEVVYLGLPSNQIGFVWQQLKKIEKSATLWSFELDPEKAEWQRKYATQFLKGDIHISNTDILEIPEVEKDSNTEKKQLVVLDLDLMKNGTPELAEKIVGIISKVSGDKTIVNITTCIGRKITKQEYIHSFKEILQTRIRQDHNKINYWFSGKYVDNIIPMVWEHISLGGK